jgi:hypothetical protein
MREEYGLSTITWTMISLWVRHGRKEWLKKTKETPTVAYTGRMGLQSTEFKISRNKQGP